MATYEEFKSFADALGAEYKDKVVITKDAGGNSIWVGAWIGEVNRGVEITFLLPFSSISASVAHVKKYQHTLDNY